LTLKQRWLSDETKMPSENNDAKGVIFRISPKNVLSILGQNFGVAQTICEAFVRWLVCRYHKQVKNNCLMIAT